LAQIDEQLAPLAASLRGALAEIDEAARSLGKYGARIEGDPQRLLELDERLELLRRLARKHGGTLAAALERRAKMKAELDALSHHDRTLAEREAEVARLGKAALELARALSAERRAAADGFSRAVAAELFALG